MTANHSFLVFIYCKLRKKGENELLNSNQVTLLPSYSTACFFQAFESMNCSFTAMFLKWKLQSKCNYWCKNRSLLPSNTFSYPKCTCLMIHCITAQLAQRVSLMWPPIKKDSWHEWCSAWGQVTIWCKRLELQGTNGSDPLFCTSWTSWSLQKPCEPRYCYHLLFTYGDWGAVRSCLWMFTMKNLGFDFILSGLKILWNFARFQYGSHWL